MWDGFSICPPSQDGLKTGPRKIRPTFCSAMQSICVLFLVRLTLPRRQSMKVQLLQNAFGIENLTMVERPEPRPGPNQVLLKMRAFSLNYRDLLVVKGQYNPKMRLPIVPLSDGVGEVAAVGDGVKRVKVGDRVCPLFVQKWLAGEPTDAAAK